LNRHSSDWHGGFVFHLFSSLATGAWTLTLPKLEHDDPSTQCTLVLVGSVLGRSLFARFLEMKFVVAPESTIASKPPRLSVAPRRIGKKDPEPSPTPNRCSSSSARGAFSNRSRPGGPCPGSGSRRCHRLFQLPGWWSPAWPNPLSRCRCPPWLTGGPWSPS